MRGLFNCFLVGCCGARLMGLVLLYGLDGKLAEGPHYAEPRHASLYEIVPDLTLVLVCPLISIVEFCGIIIFLCRNSPAVSTPRTFPIQYAGSDG